MSEKRFVIDEKTNYKDYPIILDTKTNDWWVIRDTMMGTEKLVGLLNEQQATISRLELELDTHKHPLWSTREAERKVNKLTDNLAKEVKKNAILYEEINHLRQKNAEYKSIIDFTSKEDSDLVILLMRDNIRLRQELQENMSYKTIEKGVDDGK